MTPLCRVAVQLGNPFTSGTAPGTGQHNAWHTGAAPSVRVGHNIEVVVTQQYRSGCDAAPSVRVGHNIEVVVTLLFASSPPNYVALLIKRGVRARMRVLCSPSLSASCAFSQDPFTTTNSEPVFFAHATHDAFTIGTLTLNHII